MAAKRSESRSAGSVADYASASSVGLDALSEMVAPAYPGRSVVAAELLRGGLANASFKVGLSDGSAPMVIRVYVRDPSAACREASILDLLRGRVPVPEVLYVSRETSVARSYLILRWVDGAPLHELLGKSASTDARHAVRDTGRVLAGLQGFRFASAGFFGESAAVRTAFPSAPRAIVDIVEGCLFREGGEERLGAPLTQRLWRFIAEHETTLAAVAHHAMLVHGDFSDVNIIVRAGHGAPDVAALIDWEYAHSGTPLVDLGSMLRPDPERPGWFEEELIHGYCQNGGVLPESWRQVSRIVDLVKLCAFVKSPKAGKVAVESVRILIEAALADERR